MRYRKDVMVWRYSEVADSASIGEDTVIGSHCWIGEKVSIGLRCRIQTGVFIPQGVHIYSDVFIAPHVVFTNDKYPPSKGKHWRATIIDGGVSIGANATILAGVHIGKAAQIGAGAVVTKDVPAGETWVGNPARKMQ